MYPAWWEGGPQLVLYVNNKAFDGLSAENKAIIQAASTYAHVEMQAKYDSRNPKAIKELIAEGVQLQQMPKDIMDAAFKASEELYAELSEKNANWKKIYADFSAARRDMNQWFRVTEFGFDSYMQSQKL
jgi:TRAP-type mannitol/chloroaromatic compound transport system substrate-binding protein